MDDGRLEALQLVRKRSEFDMSMGHEIRNTPSQNQYSTEMGSTAHLRAFVYCLGLRVDHLTAETPLERD